MNGLTAARKEDIHIYKYIYIYIHIKCIYICIKYI
jgi:hypothetical protein